jgi:hypothetical protein
MGGFYKVVECSMARLHKIVCAICVHKNEEIMVANSLKLL